MSFSKIHQQQDTTRIIHHLNIRTKQKLLLHENNIPVKDVREARAFIYIAEVRDLLMQKPVRDVSS